MGRLVSNGFLCAKAPLQPWFVKETAFFSAKAQKLQKAMLFALFYKAEFLDSLPVSAFAAFAIRFCHRYCLFLCKGTKAQEFCKAEFLDSLPVFAFAAFATMFCLRHCVFLCKGTKAQKAVLFAVVRRRFMEESCFLLL